MERKSYRWCVVPECTNTSTTTPSKLFIDVPRKADIRQKWFDLARRENQGMSVTSPIFFCEDHFDLPNDMENYMRYHIMGFVKRVMLKRGRLPSKFQCQKDRKRNLPSPSCPPAIKMQRLAVVEETVEESQLNNTKGTSTGLFPNIQVKVERKECLPKTQNEGVQVSVKSKYYRRKYTHTDFKPQTTISPVKVEEDVKITILGLPHIKEELIEDKSDSELSLYNSSTLSCPSPVQSLHLKSDSSSLNEEEVKIEESEAMQALDDTCKKIMAQPCLYMGLNNECYFLIDLIQTYTNIPTNHILLCLKKIRWNTTFSELADEFQISTSYAGTVFQQNIPSISNILKPFILKLEENKIKRSPPKEFGHHLDKISCIIDCFEIEIEKPSESLHQALTWSEHKKGNTIKYLISSTPNGLISYVSSGYGGQITDTLLVENCDFLDHLEPRSCVLADHGFKHIEQLLAQKHCQLLRPQNVQGAELRKHEAQITKQIESLKIHMERVISRIQEFCMLQSDSVLNSELITLLDDCVVIACALINLQDDTGH